MQHTGKDGRFDYTYYAKDDYSGYLYNLVRHAGTVYALAEHLKISHSLRTVLFEKRMLASLNYLLSYGHSCETAPDFTCIRFRVDPPRIGANALSIIAVSSVIDAYGDPSGEYLGHAVSLEKFLSYSFQNGEVVFTKPRDEIAERFEEGQMLMAWSRLYGLTGDEKYLDNATILKRSLLDKLLEQKDYALHHWYWLGLRDYFSVTGRRPNQKESEYLLTAAEKVLSLQVTGEGELHGTFRQEYFQKIQNDDVYYPYNPAALGVRVESMGALIDLLSLDNRCSIESICSRLRGGINRTITALDTVQVRGIDVLKGFDLSSLGGFYEKTRHFPIRVDYVQHSLSAFDVFSRISNNPWPIYKNP